MKMTSLIGSILMASVMACFSQAIAVSSDYGILVSKKTTDNPQWHQVVQFLQKQHNAKIFTWENSPEEVLTKTGEHSIKSAAPLYLAVVAQPQEIDRPFINKIHRLTRQFDNDPYGDCFWGIVTGTTPTAAIKMSAMKGSPLVIERALANTGLNEKRFRQDFCLPDEKAYLCVSSSHYGEKTTKTVSIDPSSLHGKGMAFLFAEEWAKIKPQVIITSSHGTQYNVEMPHSKGLLASMDGKLYILREDQMKDYSKFLSGALFQGNENDLRQFIHQAKLPELKVKETPCVWLASGNCLLGDAKNSPNTMVMTAITSLGCRQYCGYTVPTWYGRAGWGTQSFWFDNTTTTSFNEAFFLNNQSLLAETIRKNPQLIHINYDMEDLLSGNQQSTPEGQYFLKSILATGISQNDMKDALGLIYDRDTLAFYGNPKFMASFEEKAPLHASRKTFLGTNKEGKNLTLSIQADRTDTRDFGYCFHTRLTPEQVKKATITVHGETKPVASIGIIKDNFILLPNFELKEGEKASITFY